MSNLLNTVGAGVGIGGLIGSLFGGSTPSYDYTAYQNAEDLLNKQSTNVTNYFNSAQNSLESQYGELYGNTMQSAVNNLASRGIYNSPVSQVGLNKTMQGLADTYANAQANLQGQKLNATSNIDSQRIQYQMNLANTKYQTQLQEYQNNQSTYGALGGLAGALVGIL